MSAFLQSNLLELPYELQSHIIEYMDSISYTIMHFVCKRYRSFVFAKMNKKTITKGNICETVAHCGYLNILKWARKNGCPWDKWTCCGAASCGHLETLKWARKKRLSMG